MDLAVGSLEPGGISLQSQILERLRLEYHKFKVSLVNLVRSEIGTGEMAQLVKCLLC